MVFVGGGGKEGIFKQQGRDNTFSRLCENEINIKKIVHDLSR